MKNLTLKAYAKVNLGLDVVDKREDGYHNIKTVMHNIDIYDTLDFEQSDEIIITCTNPVIPTDESNIVYKCIKNIATINNTPNKLLKVNINKNIPICAGLGGGSTNGAAALIAYNKIYDLGYSLEELAKIGSKIGADIPFLIYGGVAYCEGIGEIIRRIYPKYTYHMVLCKPDFGVSTANAYSAIDTYGVVNRPDFNALMHGLLTSSHMDLRKGLINVFEPYVSREFNEIKKIKDILKSQNSLAVQMSGSGPSVFGIFANRKDALKAYENLKNIYSETFIIEMKEDFT